MPRASAAITVLYRPARKPWLRDLVDTARARANLATAPTTLAGVRQMLKALKAGEAVGLLPDQVPPRRPGRVGAFLRPRRLHHDAGRAAGAADRRRRPAGLGRAPALGPRLPRARAARGTGELAADAAAAAAQVNAQMERLIRERPQQYLWGYARYKQPRERRMSGMDERAGQPALHALALAAARLPLAWVRALGRALGRLLYWRGRAAPPRRAA